MDPEVQSALESALAEIGGADASDELEAVRVKYLGRKNGIVPALFASIKTIDADKRKARGQALKQARPQIEAALENRKSELGSDRTAGPARQDLTLPGQFPSVGRIHPLTRVTQEVCSIFDSLGFSVADGPEVETEYHNFDALNIPADHPAREEYDSFYFGKGRGLRSQTSSVQIRVMESQDPPVRVVAPGRVYRPDKIDSTHHSTFHQIEGLWVEEGVTFGDLKGVLSLFLKGLLGQDAQLRLRPSFFPFTEPSAEMDVSCRVCGGKGCKACAHAGFIEMGGCGMVDPNVLETVGYDAEKYTGFAFGFGIERLAMQRYKINDIRLFLENDLRFLEQF